MLTQFRRILLRSLATALFTLATTAQVHAQTFGAELNNSLMPASGGMAGVGNSRPQDIGSALNGNPATMTQFSGTQIMIGAAWAEATYKASYDGSVPALSLLGVDAFDAKSNAQGSLAPNIAVTRQACMFGFPVTTGFGVATGAGFATDFRNEPASGGVSSEFLLLESNIGAGVAVTDQLSVGVTVSLGFGVFDGGFVEQTSASADYGLRATLGANYALGCQSSVGVYYQTEQGFTYDDNIFIAGRFHDLKVEQPANIGLGVANSSLMCGQLLLAADVLFKQWGEADFWEALFEDQWVYQFGAQYSSGPYRLRAGYAFNTNPVRSNVGPNVGPGPLTGLQSAVEYLQATMAGAASQNRITAGVGIQDFMPGVDLDLFAGGMFEGDESYGSHSKSSVESYWIGLGLTWRIGACSSGCETESSQAVLPGTAQ
jgi:long-chain fatty acid transport protein